MFLSTYYRVLHPSTTHVLPSMSTIEPSTLSAPRPTRMTLYICLPLPPTSPIGSSGMMKRRKGRGEFGRRLASDMAVTVDGRSGCTTTVAARGFDYT